MNVNLFTISIGENENPKRLEEFEFCQNKNLQLNLSYIEIDSKHKMATYNDFFKEFEKYPNDLNIIANKDIFFDENSLNDIILFFTNYKNDLSKLCLALSRWEYSINGNSSHFNAKDSQDVWIFYGKVNYDSNSDVPLGVPGCDNRIAAELLYRYGYNVLNPSKSIKTYHYHPSGDSTRMYLNSDYSRNCYVEGPYEHLTPYKLDDE
jgi:hypothetical protein